MASLTDLLNDSLSQIGAASITAIDDGSVTANHCQRLYPALRDALIRGHHWNWAMVRVELAQDATPPTTEFAFAYTIPSDCLKIVEFAGADIDTSVSIPLFDSRTSFYFQYRVEGRKILTNYGTAFIVYLARIENPDLWDPLFYQALATWLASKLASAITKDEKKALELMKIAQEILLPYAMAVDGQEGSVSPNVSDALTWGRR